MLFFKKKIKRKNVLKINILDKVLDKFLIMRSYKNTSYIDYIVCTKYDFSSNTFPEGSVINDIIDAYEVFNNYVNNNKLDLMVNGEE